MKFSLPILIFLSLFTTHAHALPTFNEVKNSYKKSDAVLWTVTGRSYTNSGLMKKGGGSIG